MSGRTSSQIIYQWWLDVKDDRGTAARLRRAGDVTAALMVPATLQLARALGSRPTDLETPAVIAALLADVREDTPQQRVARALGTPEDRPLCSPLRFRRLLEAAPGEAQLTAFRRALALLGHQANVRDLAETLLDWTERRRQRWLYDYYHTDNPAPGQHQETAP